LRVTVKPLPRYDVGASDRINARLETILSKNDKVRFIADVGKEVGLKDERTALGRILELAAKNRQVVKRIAGRDIVCPAGMSPEVILAQLSGGS
jgi:hypothetical protein